MKHVGDALVSAIQGGHLYDSAPDVPLSERVGRQCGIVDHLAEPLRRRGEALGLTDEETGRLVQAGYVHVDRLHTATESPIERDIATALIFGSYAGFHVLSAVSHLPKQDKRFPKDPVVVVPQFAVLKYRLDFAVIGRVGEQFKLVAVECDGKEFHKDRRRDWDRDFYLRSLGFSIVRASGKDIMRSPFTVAEQASRILSDWLASR